MKTALLLTMSTAAFALATVVPAPAQSLPAGVDGYWKIVKMHPKKPVTTSGCTPNPAFFSKLSRNSKVLLSDRTIAWGTAAAADPSPRLSMMDAPDFSAHYAVAGATLHELDLDHGSKVEVITLRSPGTLPFDTIIVKDPSTLYFERCGLFMEAIHASGFVAPPLPNQQ